MECCEREREKNKGRGEVPGRSSTGCSACSLTDLWISLLSARGWLRRPTRAASGCWRHTLQRTLAAGNKLPLEISESLLRGYRGRDRVVPDGPERNRARSAAGEFECADDISLCRRGRTEERRC
ncbi:hypothetical protein ALC62_01546 [Cyphomyrmex costatus]|uniref:Uncharacterized protein n=1 Tax=Cyphomyrmex costatus TaxID=456900 RepID=A0A195D4I9_9HYME|nr:hypothetical protein ALC62_01546 [Cyphomyrmex costatus]